MANTTENTLFRFLLNEAAGALTAADERGAFLLQHQGGQVEHVLGQEGNGLRFNPGPDRWLRSTAGGQPLVDATRGDYALGFVVRPPAAPNGNGSRMLLLIGSAPLKWALAISLEPDNRIRVVNRNAGDNSLDGTEGAAGAAAPLLPGQFARVLVRREVVGTKYRTRVYVDGVLRYENAALDVPPVMGLAADYRLILGNQWDVGAPGVGVGGMVPVDTTLDDVWLERGLLTDEQVATTWRPGEAPAEPPAFTFAEGAEAADRVRPTDQVLAEGFVPGFRPPAEWFNYLLNLVGRWVNHLNTGLKSVSPAALQLRAWTWAADHVFNAAVRSNGRVFLHGLASTQANDQIPMLDFPQRPFQGGGFRRLVMQFNGADLGGIFVGSAPSWVRVYVEGNNAGITGTSLVITSNLGWSDALQKWAADYGGVGGGAGFGYVKIDAAGLRVSNDGASTTGAGTLTDAELFALTHKP